MNGDINLMPAVDTVPIKLKQEFRRWRLIWMVAGIVGVCFLALSAHRRNLLENRISDVERLSEELQNEAYQNQLLTGRLSTINLELSAEGLVPYRTEPLRVLDLLVSAVKATQSDATELSNDFEISKLEVFPADQKGVCLIELTGTAIDRQVIGAFAEALSHHQLVNPPDLTCDPPREDQGATLYPFRIRIQLCAPQEEDEGVT